MPSIHSFWRRKCLFLSSWLLFNRPHRDAALASVLYLRDVVNGDQHTLPLIQHLLRDPRVRPLRCVELGTGCGLVGIALSRLLSSCSVVLTDLPEVEDIVLHNMATAAEDDGTGPSSKTKFRVLDWDDEHLPEDICSQPIDLILVSDCTYNNLEGVVSVMAKLVRHSPEAVILLAAKRRHESEAALFDLLRSAVLEKLHQSFVRLPSQHGNQDTIELYIYGQKGRYQPA